MIKVLDSGVTIHSKMNDLIVSLHLEVGELDAEEVGGPLDVEQFLLGEAKGHPGGKNSQQVLQLIPRERKRDAGGDAAGNGGQEFCQELTMKCEKTSMGGQSDPITGQEAEVWLLPVLLAKGLEHDAVSALPE